MFWLAAASLRDSFEVIIVHFKAGLEIRKGPRRKDNEENSIEILDESD